MHRKDHSEQQLAQTTVTLNTLAIGTNNLKKRDEADMIDHLRLNMDADRIAA